MYRAVSGDYAAILSYLTATGTFLLLLLLSSPALYFPLVDFEVHHECSRQDAWGVSGRLLPGGPGVFTLTGALRPSCMPLSRRASTPTVLWPLLRARSWRRYGGVVPAGLSSLSFPNRRREEKVIC